MADTLKLNIWVKKDGTQIPLNNRPETEAYAKKLGYKKDSSRNSEASKQRQQR